MQASLLQRLHLLLGVTIRLSQVESARTKKYFNHFPLVDINLVRDYLCNTPMMGDMICIRTHKFSIARWKHVTLQSLLLLYRRSLCLCARLYVYTLFFSEQKRSAVVSRFDRLRSWLCRHRLSIRAHVCWHDQFTSKARRLCCCRCDFLVFFVI